MNLLRLHHARFRAPDLAATEAFAKDFGLLTVERTPGRLVMRTSGDPGCYIVEAAEKPDFVGFGLEVASEDDLRQAVEQHGATTLRALDIPGAGKAVSLTDPNGFEVELLVTASGRAAEMRDAELIPNSPTDRKRYGKSQSPRGLGPAHLYRLGHLGLFVKDFRSTAAWYRETFGLIASDVYHVPMQPAAQVVGFLRFDRGADWVDHHVLALMQRPQADCHHVSFEVQDFEAQFMAHRWLESRNYEPIWGVGRHPHGSHVFDVWRDPNGYRFETFSDTDLLQADEATRIHDISKVQMDVWSSDPPDRYFA